jgi:hypothetical protein
LGMMIVKTPQQQLRSIQMILQWQKLIWKNDFLWALSHFHQLMAYTQQTPFFLSLLILSTRCDKYYDVRTRTPETDPRKKGRKRLDGRKRQSDARDVVK